MPWSPVVLDRAAAQFTEYLSEEGESRQTAADLLSGLRVRLHFTMLHAVVEIIRDLAEKREAFSFVASLGNPGGVLCSISKILQAESSSWRLVIDWVSLLPSNDRSVKALQARSAVQCQFWAISQV